MMDLKKLQLAQQKIAETCADTQTVTHIGLTVTVEGRWLIENDLAEAWYQVRGLDKRPDTPGIQNGQITPDFKDYILLNQAYHLGLLEFAKKQGDMP